MSELNFRPSAGSEAAGARPAGLQGSEAGGSANGSVRASAQARQQRRRLHVLRHASDAGFRLFRVY